MCEWPGLSSVGRSWKADPATPFPHLVVFKASLTVQKRMLIMSLLQRRWIISFQMPKQSCRVSVWEGHCVFYVRYDLLKLQWSRESVLGIWYVLWRVRRAEWQFRKKMHGYCSFCILNGGQEAFRWTESAVTFPSSTLSAKPLYWKTCCFPTVSIFFTHIPKTWNM